MWDMKRLILAASLALAAPWWSAQAAGPDFVIDDREAVSEAEITTDAAGPDRPGDSSNQKYGILSGKPIFRLDPKYGEVCVQTIFGKVNGAQVQVTW
jgi:hypothetical protein